MGRCAVRLFCIPGSWYTEQVCARCRERPKAAGGYCSPCRVEITRAWELANPERAREIKRVARSRYNAKLRALRPPRPARPAKPVVASEKRCSACALVKPERAFVRDGSGSV